VSGAEKRRSARHLLAEPADVQLGTQSLLATVDDVSAHGMGLTLPPDAVVSAGDTIWIQTGKVSRYAITGTVRRVMPGSRVGVELDEVLVGESLVAVEGLPLADGPLSSPGE
jgi:hypothetical protein